jgi:hypothetical protein
MTAPAPPAPARAGNPLGVASIVLAAVLVVFGIGTRIIGYAAPSIAASAHLPASSFGVIFGALGGVGLVVGIAAAALGIVGVTRPGLPHALAAAGMAIGIFVIVSWIVSTVSAPLLATLVVPR